jgi:hypothetical protein
MADLIKNLGKWGPIEEATNTGGFKQKSYEGRQIVIDFDGSTNSGILYTGLIGVPISTETEIVWNTEAVNCADTADMTVTWQGTDDPSVANTGYGNGFAISASDTGWTSVDVQDLTGSAACDARTATNLAGVSGVVNKRYMRFKFTLATATPGDVDITCRLINLPSLSKITHSVAL